MSPTLRQTLTYIKLYVEILYTLKQDIRKLFIWIKLQSCYSKYYCTHRTNAVVLLSHTSEMAFNLKTPKNKTASMYG